MSLRRRRLRITLGVPHLSITRSLNLNRRKADGRRQSAGDGKHFGKGRQRKATVPRQGRARRVRQSQARALTAGEEPGGRCDLGAGRRGWSHARRRRHAGERGERGWEERSAGTRGGETQGPARGRGGSGARPTAPTQAARTRPQGEEGRGSARGARSRGPESRSWGETRPRDQGVRGRRGHLLGSLFKAPLGVSSRR